MHLDPDDFDELVADALDALPAELLAMLSNVVVLVEDDVPPGTEPLLGLYEGVPLTERDSGYAGVLPDTVTLFRAQLLAVCGTREEVVEEVRITVAHELAHHLGIDDDRLAELGYD